MNKVCAKCRQEFIVTENDIKFLEKISPVFNGTKYEIPPPENCPQCRSQTRMAFRNQSSLYRIKCDASGKDILSMYRSDAPFPVYSPEEWWKDTWHGTDYGQDFDFNRPFFEQFLEVKNKVPHQALIFQSNINCDFCNLVGNCKNCYLIFGSVECEDCYYGNPYKCKHCVDSFLLIDSELCLECTDSHKLYNCHHCQNCSNSSDLGFCYEVNNSQDCFGCAALNHKQYCIFNKQYSKEDYERTIKEMDLTYENKLDEIKQKFEEIKQSVPHKYYTGKNNENVTGDIVSNSKDCFDVYGTEQCRDVSYGFQLLKSNDAQDLTVGEYGELMYEISGFYRITRTIFSIFIWENVFDLIYCGYCTKNVNNCFGCIGLRDSKYCILNKKYSKEEYESLVPRIIEHMKKTGEWGQFFPIEISPFGYNETYAAEYFPLSKEEAEKQGWKWIENNEPQGNIPGDARICEVTKKPFKIIPQEKKMYERFNLPLPKRSPQQRHLDRIALRNPMKLNNRNCDKCGISLKTTYPPNSPYKVYCEKCYQKEVY